jgi:hypothetical protein
MTILWPGAQPEFKLGLGLSLVEASGVAENLIKIRLLNPKT